ncbi:hypothetical protein HS088_TW21G00682 [Tripterygium wilfordii]|uniref:Uncharacterized protein n=1 Tax=Tripterygium wilfordii TaxID=458696 RepID=A0A7J7C310_TRIWF|nr:hypothetical protein HS088_TW21G00682 [Tripterygium wilfordii]
MKNLEAVAFLGLHRSVAVKSVGNNYISGRKHRVEHQKVKCGLSWFAYVPGKSGRLVILNMVL